MILAIIQARLKSSRLPNKVLKNINDKSIIQLVLERVQRSKLVSKVIVATSEDKSNDPLVNHISDLGFESFRGSENNVLSRYYEASKYYKAKTIVRITADCPLVDSEIIDKCITLFNEGNAEYVSNINPPTFPDGYDIEVFSFNALEMANNHAILDFDKEHVTPLIRSNENLKRINYVQDDDLSFLRLTLDEQIDYQVIQDIYNYFSPNYYFSYDEIKKLFKKNPELFSANSEIVRNSGAFMSTGQKLWKRAKQVIPGGNMLLSKRAEMFLPDGWPAYFSKTKGCDVWDLDNKKYTDFALMGVGTNILGYSHNEVDDAVKRVIKQGNMSSLNCPEEVYLAEKLIEINPWAGMVRYARSGGEANAIAVRIARAAAGKDKIAICGYHGWHDWYLAANISKDDQLSGHLLPGLEPKGVPKNLEGTVFPFEYNDIEKLESLIMSEDIGVVKMEVIRNKGPENDFLRKVRDLCTKKNIVLIFDECTSGFRETFGGIYNKYDVIPDIVIFGKAIGNGYALTAIVGKTEIMSEAQSTFISSTFWTERIGPTAALKTLEIMEKHKTWEEITKIGIEIRDVWKKIAIENNLEIVIGGIPALSNFSFKKDNQIYKTFITQEMLKKGFLAGTAVYTSMAHSKDKLNNYYDSLNDVFRLISKYYHDDEIDLLSMLEYPVCHTGFKRLN